MDEEELKSAVNWNDTDKKTLDLSNWKIERLPKEIGNFRELRQLRLRGNLLSELPEEMDQLENLEELSLIDNRFTEFPRIVLKLENLKILYLGSNQISEIPDDIDRLTNLTQLNLSHNFISTLPIEIANLTNLGSLVVSFNKITEIPIEFHKLVKLRELNITFNPIAYPPKEIIEGGVMKISLFLMNEWNKEQVSRFNYFTLPLPDKIKTAIKQYLMYFNEYVFVAKGKRIHFEVKFAKNGLEVEVLKEEATEDISRYLEEYLGFIKRNIDDIQPEFETNLPAIKQDLLTIELKNQLRHLQTSLEIKQVEIKFLNEKIADVEERAEQYYNLLILENKRPQNLYLSSYSSSVAVAKSESTFELKDTLPLLLREFGELKGELASQDGKIKEELELIDKELLELEPSNDDPNQLNKAPFRRLKRLLDQINDPNSLLNKTISASKKGVAACQKVGKIYNKFAQWLGMPQVPDIFL